MYSSISPSLGVISDITLYEEYDENGILNVKTAFQWEIKNFFWLLDNQINREIYGLSDLCDSDVAENREIKIEVKIKLCRKDNEVIEVYFMPLKSEWVKTEVEHGTKYFDKYLVKDYSWVVQGEWHFAAVLSKSAILREIESDTDKYCRSLFFKISLYTPKRRMDLVLPVVYGPQTKSNEKGNGVINHDLCTHLEVIFVSKTVSDVTVRSVEGEEFPAHRVVLAARSAVLRAHLNHDTEESRTRTIDTAFCADTVKGMLCYIYTDTVPNINEISDKLLVAADFYLIKGLKELCANKLIEKLTIENAIKTLELAHLYSALRLKNQALEFIHRTPKNIITKTEGWKALQTVELLKTIYEYTTDLVEDAEGDDEAKNESTKLDIESRSGLYPDLQKLFREEPIVFTDIVIKSEDGGQIHCHKVILAARSEVFKAHFEHSKENSENIIESPFEIEVLQQIVNFMYTDQTLHEMSVKLLEAAHFYQLQGLKISCEKQLHKKLNVENAIEFLEIAEKYRAPYLMRHCLEYINNGPSNEIIKTEGWKRLLSADLAKRLHECKIDDFFYEVHNE